MLKVPATSQINRVEQCGEFCKKSLKMCSEHNEAKLICCFLSGNKYCMGRKKKEHRPGKYSCTLKMGQSWGQQLSPEITVFIKKKQKKEEKLGAVFMHLHVNISG